ncbi:MAG: Mrp/NBP35 family ATP-binding protein [Lentisphaerae bacterium]|nr:Mrp/NBP35 family ATP-binding protein [Lentisphaerota bacterium]
MSESCSGNCSSCNHDCGDENRKMQAALGKIKNKIVVMSGKGGVGKSTVAVNLAVALALSGKKVGLLDVDIHGPSVPQMLNLQNTGVMMDGDKILPQEIGSLKVISLGFMIDDPDGAIVWRGPMKIGVIKQLVGDVEWGELDYLVIDSPPGTGDEPLTVCQLISDASAIIVTTPQQVAANDVAKSLNFCKQLEFNVLGLVENMSGLVCPHCKEVVELFPGNAGEELSEKFGVKLLAKIPLDPAVAHGGDAGTPFVQRFAKTVPGKIFLEMVENLFDC